jgi:chromate reductase, NAD(P)H dehydrogenase (quinone)
MITIIAGTNRPDSNTIKVANTYFDILKNKNINAQLLSLTALTSIARNQDFEKIETEILIPTQKFIVVIPEYNGTMPGVFKLLIDNSKPNLAWYFKKYLMVGVATGRAGNLRGMDHAAESFAHMKGYVHYNKLPISGIDKLLGPDQLINHEPTLNAIHLQIDDFLKF